MSDTDRSARPRQLTAAGGFVIGGSIFLVLSVFDTLTKLHSVQMHDQIQKALSSPTGSSLGFSVGQALTLMRVGVVIAPACAAAAAVLGVYVLQRNRAARVALTVLAVPILLTSPLTGGLVGALVAAATLMLWSGPARDWFAGRPGPPAGPAGATVAAGPVGGDAAVAAGPGPRRRAGPGAATGRSRCADRRRGDCPDRGCLRQGDPAGVVTLHRGHLRAAQHGERVRPTPHRSPTPG